MFMNQKDQIQNLLTNDIQKVIDQMPSDGCHRESFEFQNGVWLFSFECKAASYHFQAAAYGNSPEEAFHASLDNLFSQIRDWQKQRLQHQLPTLPRIQRVLIVDDDLDVALALEAGILQLGFHADVVTSHHDLHRKIIETHPDLILMDWQLNEHVMANLPVEKASLLMSAFSALRNEFGGKQTPVITHSVLPRESIKLLGNSDSFFNHVDHWQKPMPFQEVLRLTAKFLRTCKGDQDPPPFQKPPEAKIVGASVE